MSCRQLAGRKAVKAWAILARKLCEQGWHPHKALSYSFHQVGSFSLRQIPAAAADSWTLLHSTGSPICQDSPHKKGVTKCPAMSLFPTPRSYKFITSITESQVLFKIAFHPVPDVAQVYVRNCSNEQGKAELQAALLSKASWTVQPPPPPAPPEGMAVVQDFKACCWPHPQMLDMWQQNSMLAGLSRDAALFEEYLHNLAPQQGSDW